MEIKTKYDLNDPCWIMFSNKPEQVTVNGIFVLLTDEDGNIVTNLEYEIKRKYGSSGIRCKEKLLFPTKSELLKTL